MRRCDDRYRIYFMSNLAVNVQMPNELLHVHRNHANCRPTSQSAVNDRYRMYAHVDLKGYATFSQ